MFGVPMPTTRSVQSQTGAGVACQRATAHGKKQKTGWQGSGDEGPQHRHDRKVARISTDRKAACRHATPARYAINREIGLSSICAVRRCASCNASSAFTAA